MPLFPPLPPLAREALEGLPDVLEKVWPLNRARRKALPEDIAELSTILTSERCRLRHSYWEKPNLVSAYLYYFLPWNILRLCRLFGGLELSAPQKDAWLVDAGAGCLALPIALWLVRPCSLRVLATDRALRPMRLGVGIFRELGRLLQKPVWPIRLAKLHFSATREMRQMLDGNVWLFSAANVLNEVLSSGSARPADEGREGPDFEELDGRGEEFPDEGLLVDCLEAVHPFLEAGARFLAVEPGTRLGGTDIMRLRKLALAGGLHAHSPCTRQGKCPLLERAQRKGTSLGSAWCHFTFDTGGAPDWLLELSRKAGLGKKSLSLSPLLLSAKPATEADDLCRVLSHPFDAPGISPDCRYGCARVGLTILPNAKWLFEGLKLPVRVPANEQRDKKSGAVIVEPAGKTGR